MFRKSKHKLYHGQFGTAPVVYLIFLAVVVQLLEVVFSSESNHTLFQHDSYFVHILNDVERKNAFLQKCCPQDEVLDGNGGCHKREFLLTPIETLKLGQRLGRTVHESSSRNTSKSDDPGNDLLFRFVQRRPECPSKLRQLVYNVLTSSKDLRFTSSLQFVTRAVHISDSENGIPYLIIDPRDYCIDWVQQDTIGIQFCAPEACPSTASRNFQTFLGPNKKGSVTTHNDISPASSFNSAVSRPLCLRKCCPPSKAINIDPFGCVQYDIPWQLYPLDATGNPTQMSKDKKFDPSRNPSEGNDDETNSQAVPLAVTWLTGTPSCVPDNSYEVYSDKYDRYHINGNGILVTEWNGTVSETPPEEYCFDAVVLHDEEGSKDTVISRQMAMVCFEEEDDADKIEKAEEMESTEVFSWRMLYTVLTGISCIFLFITCLVYGILWKDLNLPGWLQFAYASFLLLTFMLLTVAQLWTQQIHDISKNLCRALGYGLHFFFLSCFFWLTSMNLDLWLSFRNTVLVRGFGKSRGKRRFLEFTAFSVGFPATITLVLLAADQCSPDDDSSSFCILPNSGIGVDSCVLDTQRKVAQFHFFYFFVGILLFVNFGIFVCTLISLRNRERETRIAKRQSTSSSDYDRLQLFIRLLLISGTIWIFEVISWIFGYFYGQENVQKIFVLTDCLNASQGVVVFLMFVWKRQTWKQLKKKFKTGAGIRGRRPLSRPSYACTMSNGQHTNETSVKSSHLSSTKSTESSQLPSTSTTISQLEFEH